MFRVYFPNLWYFADAEFPTFEAAAEYGRSVCFEFQVHCSNEILYAWGPISGGRFYGAAESAPIPEVQ